MSIRSQVIRFWNVFVEEQKNLEFALDNNNVDEINEIVKILSTYFEELCNCNLEIEKNDDFYEITFNSDGDKNAQYICALMKKMAPEAVIEKWIVNAFVPPMSERALNTVLMLKNHEYTHKDFDIFYQIDDVNRMFNFEVYCPAFVELEPNKALEISMYLIKMFVGETLFESNVNNINAIYELSDYDDSCKLIDLYEVMLKVIEDNEWPVYSDPTQIYMMYKLDDELKDETLRHDMLMIFTTNPHMISETLTDDAFIANSFYDLGGEFGYLYYEHNGDESKKGAYRQKLEQVLNSVLYDETQIARSIGGAIGSKYAYIDLAIFDKEKFNKMIPVLQEKLPVNIYYQRFE